MNTSKPTKNLFTSKEFEDFKANVPEVVSTPRTVIDHHMTIDGHKFDLDDLYGTLNEIDNRDVYLTDENMIKVFQKLGVITHPGSNRGMRVGLGENFAEFHEIIRQKFYAAEESEK